MRNLLQCVALCAFVSLCVCYDSNESSESAEDVFVSPHQANSFIAPQRGNPVYNPVYNPVPPRGNFYSRFTFAKPVKSPAERRAETCEDYVPCRHYAYRHGYQQAYQRFYGAAQVPVVHQNPHVARRV